MKAWAITLGDPANDLDAHPCTCLPGLERHDRELAPERLHDSGQAGLTRPRRAKHLELTTHHPGADVVPIADLPGSLGLGLRGGLVERPHRGGGDHGALQRGQRSGRTVDVGTDVMAIIGQSSRLAGNAQPAMTQCESARLSVATAPRTRTAADRRPSAPFSAPAGSAGSTRRGRSWLRPTQRPARRLDGHPAPNRMPQAPPSCYCAPPFLRDPGSRPTSGRRAHGPPFDARLDAGSVGRGTHSTRAPLPPGARILGDGRMPWPAFRSRHSRRRIS